MQQNIQNITLEQLPGNILQCLFNVYSMSITKNKIDDIIKGYAKMKVAK